MQLSELLHQLFVSCNGFVQALIEVEQEGLVWGQCHKVKDHPDLKSRTATWPAGRAKRQSTSCKHTKQESIGRIQLAYPSRSR